MLFIGFWRSLVLICIYVKFIYAADEPCPDPASIAPCKCYTITRQIRCENSALTNIKLKEIGSKLKGVWDFLYIHDTLINAIDADTFKTIQFKQIIISNNYQLRTIDSNSFVKSSETILLSIRQNQRLEKSGLFDIAKLFADNLVEINFDGNDIEDFEGISFSGSVFTKLEMLNLQKQATINAHNQTTVLPIFFIDKLTHLKQLSLDFIGLKTISDGAIDLFTSTTNHISIFLNDNNLGATEFTDKKIILPTIATKATTATTVGLDIEYNKIYELTTDLVRLFSVIAAKGNVYLKGNAITKCLCSVALPLKPVFKNLHFTPEPVCDADKKIESC